MQARTGMMAGKGHITHMAGYFDGSKFFQNSNENLKLPSIEYSGISEQGTFLAAKSEEPL
jgi:hypothetical protein